MLARRGDATRWRSDYFAVSHGALLWLADFQSVGQVIVAAIEEGV